MRDAPGQKSLFGAPRTGREEYADTKPIRLNSTVADEDKPRLARKYDEVLARLKEGPATAAELNAIAFSYGQRLHEMKAAGIAWGKERKPGGMYTYWLIGE